MSQNLPDPAFLAQATIIAALGKTVAAARQRMSAKLNSLPRGTKLTAIDPETGITYGTVSMSNPRPEAYVTDRDEFEAWCRRNYPDKIDTWTAFTDYDAAVAVVTQHAPELVEVRNTVPGEVMETALVRAVSEDIPGTKRRTMEGTVSVRSNPEAAKLVRQMLESASVRLPELEA